MLKRGKLSKCRNREVTLSVGRCGVATVLFWVLSSGGWVAICSCGHLQRFEGIMCFRILSSSAVFCLLADILDSACDTGSAVIICDVTRIMSYVSMCELRCHIRRRIPLSTERPPAFTNRCVSVVLLHTQRY